jgi:hypothetical protein
MELAKERRQLVGRNREVHQTDHDQYHADGNKHDGEHASGLPAHDAPLSVGEGHKSIDVREGVSTHT